ncbi:Holliday junction branch migration protein RuvA [Pelolinea submarina]|uniref:Holliday junction branch migration complex subunit RuvA n=1 Tax=Pelolinea submarina TaxID=913107 RepID=A0A347ZSN0_9CHLR|nr:Holliday junction branch migration protein RuvA [Pelolinea submarina]REG11116.1 Holliday junction DNA helicase subunit RuvA [Pelolinea submarina]BBB48311.1 Holliday junction DNA helicase RuvA [Pelolinea submarina]
MIASVKGEIIDKGDSFLVVQVGGVGLRVFVPASLTASYEIGEHAQLFTHLVVREDNLSLYGFDGQESRSLFQNLITVNGVGPRLALAVLSSLSVDMIYQAVLGEQAQVFAQVPGIGSKTAQKIVLYLHDKLKPLEAAGIISGVRDVNRELMDALVGLGYSVVEAQTAIQALPKDAPEELEERLRLALQFFTH